MTGLRSEPCPKCAALEHDRERLTSTLRTTTAELHRTRREIAALRTAAVTACEVIMRRHRADREEAEQDPDREEEAIHALGSETAAGECASSIKLQAALLKELG